MSEQQSPQAQAVLAKLDASLADNDLHPILKPVLVFMQDDDGEWWPAGMPLENVTEIKRLFDAALADGSIIKAVYDLLQCATAVGATGTGKMVAAHLVRICNDVIHEKKLLAMFDADAEFAPGSIQKAAALTGGASRPAPAKFGDKPPTGTLRIDQLAGGKRRL